MDHYRSSQQQQDQDGLGAIPVSLGGYHNPPPPPANPIRVSAFSKPSSSSPLNILSPKDHHLHHPPHHGPPRNNNGSSTAAEFTTPTTAAAAAAAAAADHHPLLADPIPVSVTPTSTVPPATGSAPNPSKAAFRYRECLRNHAASVGGHVLDGCCEFMPSSTDPLKCAACDCHRSFHRKLAEGEPVAGSAGGSYYSSRRDRISVPLLLPPPHPAALHHHSHLSQKQQQHQFASAAAFPPSPSGVAPGSSPMVAFGGNNSGSGATTESSSEERLDAGVCGTPQQNTVVSKKRYRTKFSAEQKEKMLGFAERAGWRIQRQDDAAVESFCREIGVRRQVLKVWMHNNKHSIRKQQQEQLQQQQQQIHHQAADSASTPMSAPQPPAQPVFGHVRN